jgi:hypothetical protein
MDTSEHTLSSLFDQLGLPSNPEAIITFITEHKLPKNQKIYDASFWNSAQASFLAESLQQDADWAEIIDQLANMLIE